MNDEPQSERTPPSEEQLEQMLTPIGKMTPTEQREQYRKNDYPERRRTY